jgi:hypothetical protein
MQLLLVACNARLHPRGGGVRLVTPRAAGMTHTEGGGGDFRICIGSHGTSCCSRSDSYSPRATGLALALPPEPLGPRQPPSNERCGPPSPCSLLTSGCEGVVSRPPRSRASRLALAVPIEADRLQIKPGSSSSSSASVREHVGQYQWASRGVPHSACSGPSACSPDCSAPHLARRRTAPAS